MGGVRRDVVLPVVPPSHMQTNMQGLVNEAEPNRSWQGTCVVTANPPEQKGNPGSAPPTSCSP